MFSGSDSIDGGDGSDALYYGYGGEIPDGASIVVDFTAGTVSKYVAGELIGIDTIASIDSVYATGGIHFDIITPVENVEESLFLIGMPRLMADYFIS